MRTFLMLLAIVSLSVPASAQQVGDYVIVTVQEEAELLDGGKTAITMPRGTHVKIREIADDRYRTRWKSQQGWVRRADVLPLEAAMKFFNSVLEENPNAGDLTTRSKIRLLQNKDPEKALADLNEAIELAPQYKKAYVGRGYVRMEQGELDAAIRDLEKVIQIDSNYAPAYNTRAMVLSKQGDLDQAIADSNKAIELDPNYPEFYFSRGRYRLLKGESQKAIDDYTEAIERDPEISGYFTHRGYAYGQLGESDEAIADYNRALRADDEICRRLPFFACISDTMSVLSDIMSASNSDKQILSNIPRTDQPPRKADQTRDAILAAALDFLWTHPFRDLTVGGLMSKTDHSRSAFYQYFDDLHDMMETLLLGVEKDIFTVAEPWFHGEGDPIPLLCESLKGLVDVCYERGPILCAVTDAAASDEKMDAAWRSVLTDFDKAITTRIEQQQQRGLIAQFEASPVAVALNRMDAALLIHAFGRRPRGDPDAVLRSLTRIWVSTLYGPETLPNL